MLQFSATHLLTHASVTVVVQNEGQHTKAFIMEQFNTLWVHSNKSRAVKYLTGKRATTYLKGVNEEVILKVY